MTQTLLAWTNLAKAADVVASNEEAAYPATNTLQDIGSPSVGWQTEPSVTTASLEYTLAVAGSEVLVVGLFRTNLTSLATITVTGTYGGIDTWTETLSGPVTGIGQVIFVLAAREFTDVVTIEIADPTNPDGKLNVPLVFIGDAWVPTYSIAPDFTDGWLPQRNTLTSRGGQKYITLLANPRMASFSFQAIPTTEAYAAAREIARLAGLGINVLMVPNTGGAIQYEAVFGIVETRSMGMLSGSSYRTWSVNIEERL